MAHSGGAEEENYWPGYVDALTTMLMVLTFVMMVLGIVVFTLSQNVSKNLVQAMAKAAQVDTSELASSTPDEMQKAVLTAIAEKVGHGPQQAQDAAALRTTAPASGGEAKAEAADAAVAMRQPAPQPGAGSETHTGVQILQETAAAPAPDRREAELRASASDLQILFRNGSVQLDERNMGALDAYVGASRAARYVVRGVAGAQAGGATEARRRAYYRAMLVRARMVARGIPAERVTVQVRDAQPGLTPDAVDVLTHQGS
ncbi:hypothetical protein SLNSH_02645 [Alsobacter soli]|uniref:Flagellar motor protein MotB n=1 Tax=Alsobacter soli TaxID=2109933 RepID=A0A2T1HYE4_9HYPH|nr:hypothetical protein [Alsobacter soli]PSC06713.1 hypothetical protein SLNSH_02645 [Alsobacter soli]